MMNENLQQHFPEKEYRGIIEKQEAQIRLARSKKKNISAGRLITVLAAVLLIWLSWPVMSRVALVAVAASVIFALLIARDSTWSSLRREAETLILINRRELDSLAYDMETYDSGSDFLEPAHAYAGDLDLFGPHSLYQWINRASGDPGKKQLATELKNGLPAEMLKNRQQAVAELAGQTEWTQQFRLKSMEAPLSAGTRVRVENWLSQPEDFLDKPVWKRIIALHSVTGLCLLALFIFDIFSLPAFALGFIILRFIAFGISGRIMPMYTVLSRTAPEMEGLYGQLAWLGSAVFQSPLLHSLQQKQDTEGSSATGEMRRLFGILKRFDVRLNLIVSNILNTFLLWDLRQALALRQWKIDNKERLPGWIDRLAETEVLISLAALKHNQPDWCFPDTSLPYFTMEAELMGHPLIPAKKRVNQNFRLDGPGKAAIITGANMAGKSTFLRSLGVNAVLAYIGSPVCAAAMRISRAELITSMRVTDNLAENTSTFYAELKKLGYIITRVNAGADLFILLDEVLRGTNSEDRHSGTTALVRQLLRGKTTSVIATHDTQLARTEAERSADAVDNYHFDGKVTGSELSFDYQLKPGICESLNATALMKKIGIQIDE